MLLDHLSGPWLDAVDAELAARDRLRTQAATCPLGITQVVTGGDAPLVYHFTSHGGAARVDWGPADPEDVRVTEDRVLAAAIASGRASAAEAFISGRVLITGDRDKLLDGRDLLAAFDAALVEVTRRTRFDGA
jgi:hypothetical protein